MAATAKIRVDQLRLNPSLCLRATAHTVSSSPAASSNTQAISPSLVRESSAGIVPVLDRPQQTHSTDQEPSMSLDSFNARDSLTVGGRNLEIYRLDALQSRF